MPVCFKPPRTELNALLATRWFDAKRFSKLPVTRASTLAPVGRRASRAFAASALSRESDFGVTSVNWGFANLLARAEAPR